MYATRLCKIWSAIRIYSTVYVYFMLGPRLKLPLSSLSSFSSSGNNSWIEINMQVIANLWNIYLVRGVPHSRLDKHIQTGCNQDWGGKTK